MENAKSKVRLSHVDDVRSLVIFLVVMVHSSVTYSGLGGWYVIENRSDSIGPVAMAVLGLFNSFSQAWFMGIMFFFGGYFAAEGRARKGLAIFVRDRLLRLGIPLAAYVFVINPLLSYYLANPAELQAMSLPGFLAAYVAKGWFFSGTGPLWFAEALLVFCLVYAAGAKFFSVAKVSAMPGKSVRNAPGVASLVFLMLAVGVTAFLVRIPFPIGTDVCNMQVCFFPSYIVLFVLGIRGFGDGWFEALTSGKNVRWFVLSLCVGIPVWGAIMVFGGALSGELSKSFGGVHWQSAAYAFWEAFVAIGMSVGLTALFANRRAARDERTDGGVRESPGMLSRFLSRNSFSVYVFHPVILISLTRLFSGWGLPPIAKAAVIGSMAYALSLLFAEFAVRRIPGVRKYL